MRFKDVFSIIGPSMIGPSSSHTAGAVRLGLVGRMLLGEQPEQAIITLYGSFADTGLGHGTDLALTAGLLGWNTDDSRIPEALRYAEQQGLQMTFRRGSGRTSHPNTAELEVTVKETSVRMKGTSIGGGNIKIQCVDDFDVSFTGMYPTLLLYHDDRSGVIAGITQIMNTTGTNIGYMDLDRKARNGEALTVLETDQALDESHISQLGGLPFVRKLSIVDIYKLEKEMKA
ncbi:L-serine ammonia-lyase, iron-sulfur-dependent subunit beta [Paenibacillus sp. 22594]|uniref:L-serine ammonia-lyase, iron-sulfur-dependent subunit beta n=1 Tax=Paenibacillus sp. 22594 TaxID=3453947 RepID=UPI003F87A6F8